MFKVNYVKPTQNLVYDQRHLGPAGQELVQDIDQKILPIEDARAKAQAFSLQHNGFELAQTRFPFKDFEDDNKIEHTLYPLAQHWLQKKLGASEVVLFDHTFRSTSHRAKTAYNRAPVKTVHNDYTASSARHRLYQETQDKPELRNNRHQFINIWMPVYHPVEESPLALVDLTTVSDQDYHHLKLIYPDRVGQLAGISYNPQHKWYYFSDMKPGEALLLKVFDSNRNKDSSGTPHSAVEAVANSPVKHSRASIEIRTIAFFEEH